MELSSGLSSGLLSHLAVLRRQSQALGQQQQAALARTRRKAALRAALAKARDELRRLDEGEREARDVAGASVAGAVGGARRGARRAALGDVYRIGTVRDVVARRKHAREGRRTSSRRHDAPSPGLAPAGPGEEGRLRNDAALAQYVESTAEDGLTKHAAVDLMLAHRLAGASIFRTQAGVAGAAGGGAGLVGLRFDTSHQGQFFERYYALLKPARRPGQTHSMRLQRHTFPHFVPLERLFAEHGHDLGEFLRLATAYLRAFVTRREQMKQVLAGAGAPASVSCVQSAASDAVTFSGKALGEGTVRILYKSLLDVVPDEVILKPSEALKEVKVKVQGNQTGHDITVPNLFKECQRILKSF